MATSCVARGDVARAATRGGDAAPLDTPHVHARTSELPMAVASYTLK